MTLYNDLALEPANGLKMGLNVKLERLLVGLTLYKVFSHHSQDKDVLAKMLLITVIIHLCSQGDPDQGCSMVRLLVPVSFLVLIAIKHLDVAKLFAFALGARILT